MSTPTVPGWPGNHALASLAKATYSAAMSLGFGLDYPARAAAGALMLTTGEVPRDPSAIARQADQAMLNARALGTDPWAAFVAAVLP